MQLSDDPDDWVWVRWYWCQPGAQPLDVWTAFGHPLWEKSDGNEKEGPRILLDDGIYARSAVSPHPGLDHRGRDEWYEDGLPEDERDDLAVADQCDGEMWDTEAAVSASVLIDEPEGRMTLRGGVGIGGPMVLNGVCLIWYGGCLHLKGGIAFGGHMPMFGAYGERLRGGLAVGGSLRMAGGGSMSLRGGIGFGGAMRMGGSSSMRLAGGLAVGGRTLMGGSGEMALAGGVAFGGRMIMAGPSMVLGGGVAFGGSLLTERCGPAPWLVVADGPHAFSTDTIAIPLPPEAGAGDLMVFVLWSPAADGEPELPPAWVPIASDAIGPDERVTVLLHRCPALPIDSQVFFPGGATTGFYATIVVENVLDYTGIYEEYADAAGVSITPSTLSLPWRILASTYFPGIISQGAGPGYSQLWDATEDMGAYLSPVFGSETLLPQEFGGGPSGPKSVWGMNLRGFCLDGGSAKMRLRGGVAFGGAMNMEGSGPLIPLFVGNGTASYPFSGQVDLSAPSHASGDLLIAVVAADSDTPNWDEASGWTLVDAQALSSPGFNARVYTRVGTGALSPQSWRSYTGSQGWGIMWAVRNATTVVPGTFAVGSGDPGSAPGVTLGATDELAAFMLMPANSVSADPAGLTRAFGFGTGVYLWYADEYGAGASGSVDAGLAGGADWCAWAFDVF